MQPKKLTLKKVKGVKIVAKSYGKKLVFEKY